MRICKYILYISALLANTLYLPSSPHAQVITPISFECGGVATADLDVGDVVTVTHSLDETDTFFSALVQVPQPPFVLISGVQTTVHTAGVPVTQVLPITTAPAAGTSISFAVTLFANNVAVDCPTYDATITKNVNLTNINSLPATLTYTINVENTGTGNLDAPVLSDTLTQGATSLTLTSGPTLTSGDVDNDGSIDPTETFVYTATYDVTQANMDDGGDIDNEVDFSATFLPTITSNVATTSIATNATLSVTKTAIPAFNVPAGQTVTYSYEVTNTGNQTLTNIVLTDLHNGSGPPPVPANETFTTDGGLPGGSSDGGDDGVWDILGPGDVITFTGSYVVTQNDVDTLQ